MKRIIYVLLLGGFAIACGSSGPDKTTTAGNVSDNPDYKKGLALIADSDCLTCHKIDEASTGPSYREVAKKYAGSDTAVSYLAGKIINGGKGIWGEAYMTPHSDLSKEDAEGMVRYILLLKQ